MSFSFECIGCGRVHGDVSEKLDGKKIRCDCGMVTRVYFKSEPVPLPELEPLKHPLPLLPPEPKAKPGKRSSGKTVVLPTNPRTASAEQVPSFDPLPRVEAPKPRQFVVMSSDLPPRHNLTTGMAICCGLVVALSGLYLAFMSFRPIGALNEQIREVSQAWGLTNVVIVLAIATFLAVTMFPAGLIQLIHGVNELTLRKVRRSWPDFLVFAIALAYLFLVAVAMVLGTFNGDRLEQLFSHSAGLDAYYLRKSVEVYGRAGPLLVVSMLCVMLVSFLRMFDRSTTRKQIQVVQRIDLRE